MKCANFIDPSCNDVNESQRRHNVLRSSHPIISAAISITQQAADDDYHRADTRGDI